MPTCCCGGVTEIIVLHFFPLENFDVAPTAQRGASTIRSAAEWRVEDLWAEHWRPRSPKKQNQQSL